MRLAAQHDLLNARAFFHVDDLRFFPAKIVPRTLHCVVVDASGSMRAAWGHVLDLGKFNNQSIINELQKDALAQLPPATRALLRIAAHAYRRRQDWALIHFGANAVTLVNAPHRAHAGEALAASGIRAAGSSPIAQALALAERTAAIYKRRHAAQAPSAPTPRLVLWLISDARFAPPPVPQGMDAIVVVDAQPVRARQLGFAQSLAQHWGAIYWGNEIIVF